MFGVLDLFDFVIIALIIIVCGSGVAVYLRPVDRDRLIRVEDKLDFILTHLGLDYTPPTRATWQQLAEDPTRMIAAIKAYRKQHPDSSLAAAKQAVEEYVRKRGEKG